MRPRFAIKDDVPEADDETSKTGTGPQSSKTKKDDIKKEEKGNEKKSKLTDRPFGKEKGRREGPTKEEMIREDGIQTTRSTAASAIYVSNSFFLSCSSTDSCYQMPYLSFSTQCAGTDDGGSTDTNSGPEGEEDVAELTRLFDEREKYRKLLSDHEGQIIHWCPTLDEWYYHFDLRDLESTKDKDERNKSQVVHNYLPNDVKKKSHWPLIRVNQLWIWTLSDSMSL